MPQEVFEKKKPSLIEMILAGNEDGECIVDADKYTEEDIAKAYFDYYGEKLDLDFIDEVKAKSRRPTKKHDEKLKEHLK